MLEGNPTLIRLRELEVLEPVATSGRLNVVLGEKGLAERVVNLLLIVNRLECRQFVGPPVHAQPKTRTHP